MINHLQMKTTTTTTIWDQNSLEQSKGITTAPPDPPFSFHFYSQSEMKLRLEHVGFTELGPASSFKI